MTCETSKDTNLRFLDRAIEFITKKAKELVDTNKVPGITIGLTNSRKTICYISRGLSDIEKKTPITENTIFLLASVSKPLSGTLLSLLQMKNEDVDIIDKKCKIKMIDEFLTENLTVKDLVTHRSGIPNQYGTVNELVGYTRDEIIKNLRNVSNCRFRDRYSYTNLPFTEGVKIGCEVAGYDLNRGYQYLFDTVGMTSSSIDYQPNKYKGYIDTRILGPTDSSIWYPSFKYNVEEQVSAGGIYSTTRDLNKFMRFHLRQLQLPDENKLVDPIFYKGVYIREGGDIIGIGIDITYDKAYSDTTLSHDNTKILHGDGDNLLFKSYKFSGALENVRTSFNFVPYFDIGIYVGINGSPNAYPEAIIASFFAILNGKSSKEATQIFDKNIENIFPLLISEFCPLSKEIKGKKVKDTSSIMGTYRSNIYMDITINADGTIKVGKLQPVQLFMLAKNKYEFLLYNKEHLPFVGNLTILDKKKISLTYYCSTDTYKLIKC